MCNEEPHFLFYLWEVGFGVEGLSLFCDLKSLLVHIGINLVPSLGHIRLISYSISIFIQVLISVSNQAIYDMCTGLHILCHALRV
jgi:hypothetical protein